MNSEKNIPHFMVIEKEYYLDSQEQKHFSLLKGIFKKFEYTLQKQKNILLRNLFETGIINKQKNKKFITEIKDSLDVHIIDMQYNGDLLQNESKFYFKWIICFLTAKEFKAETYQQIVKRYFQEDKEQCY